MLYHVKQVASGHEIKMFMLLDVCGEKSELGHLSSVLHFFNGDLRSI